MTRIANSYLKRQKDSNWDKNGGGEGECNTKCKGKPIVKVNLSSHQLGFATHNVANITCHWLKMTIALHSQALYQHPPIDCKVEASSVDKTKDFAFVEEEY